MPKDKSDGKGKAKVRIFYAELEGGDETIQEGIRSIGQSWVRAVQPSVVYRQAQPALPAGSTVNFAAQPLDVDDAEMLEEEVPEPENSEDNGKLRTKRQKKANIYSIIGELDLRPQGKSSLKEYFAEKQPSDHQEKLTVIVYYLSKTLGIDKIEANHIYTGFKEVEQKSPANIDQIVRNIENRKGWLSLHDTKGVLITVKGENFVEQDLANKGSKKPETVKK